MRKIEKLRLSALRACANQMHCMKPFFYLYDRWCMPHKMKSGRSTCMFCNASVTIIKDPAPNQCNIMGDAVAVECTNIYHRRETA